MNHFMQVRILAKVHSAKSKLGHIYLQEKRSQLKCSRKRKFAMRMMLNESRVKSTF